MCFYKSEDSSISQSVSLTQVKSENLFNIQCCVIFDINIYGSNIFPLYPISLLSTGLESPHLLGENTTKMAVV